MVSPQPLQLTTISNQTQLCHVPAPALLEIIYCQFSQYANVQVHEARERRYSFSF